MKLAEYLDKKLIFLDVPYSTKDGLIEFLTHAVCKYYNISEKNKILSDVKERENAKSTGLGKGLAIAHGREESMERMYVAFARSAKGIEWASIDTEPVHYIFFIIGPSKLESEYLKALSDISRIMMRHDVRETVGTAKDPVEIIKIVKDSGTRKIKRKG